MELKEKMYLAFDRSKANLNWTLLCSVLVISISALQIFNVIQIDPLAVGIIIFLIQGISFYLRNIRLPSNYSLGEKIRRIFMLKDGLGKIPSEQDLATILYDLDGDLPGRVQIADEYYESKSVPGVKRLMEHIRESSFFSFNLASSASTVVFAATGIGILSSIFSFILIAREASSATFLPVSKAFILGLTFWVCGDLLTLGIRFFRVSNAMEKIFGKTSNMLRDQKISEQEAMIIFSDYNCVLTSAPPIPQWLYKRRQKKLNKAWAGRKLG